MAPCKVLAAFVKGFHSINVIQTVFRNVPAILGGTDNKFHIMIYPRLQLLLLWYDCLIFRYLDVFKSNTRYDIMVMVILIQFMLGQSNTEGVKIHQMCFK